MSETSSEKSEKLMPVTVEEAHLKMREAIDECAFPLIPGEKMKTWMPRVARDVKIALNRLYDIYAGETVPRWHEGETIRRQAQIQRERWADMKRRQSLAELKSDIRRTGDHGALLARRATDYRNSDLAREEAERQGRFVFWLGREGSELDREGDA